MSVIAKSVSYVSKKGPPRHGLVLLNAVWYSCILIMVVNVLSKHKKRSASRWCKERWSSLFIAIDLKWEAVVER